jgi:hypothetical protein
MKGFAYDLEMVGEMGGWCWDCCVFNVFFTDGGSGMKSPFENEGICLRFGDEPASGRIGLNLKLAFSF